MNKPLPINVGILIKIYLLLKYESWLPQIRQNLSVLEGAIAPHFEHFDLPKAIRTKELIAITKRITHPIKLIISEITFTIKCWYRTVGLTFAINGFIFPMTKPISTKAQPIIKGSLLNGNCFFISLPSLRDFNNLPNTARVRTIVPVR